MTEKIAPGNPTTWNQSRQKKVRAGAESNDARMEEEIDHALKLAQKAMREGRAGVILDGESGFVIVER